MLTILNLSKRYGSLQAVDGLSLTLTRGEIFGLLGPNGAGKSTTVLMTIGAVAPDSGSINLEPFGDPRRAQTRKHMGIAPQRLSLYDPLTAEENLRFFGRLHGLRGAQLTARVQWALEFAGLLERRHDKVANFSGGMQRRLNLAAAVLHDPQFILLDEPTAGVDPQSRNLIFENVLALKARGRTVLYTTHYMEEAARLCDRVAIIDNGRLLAIDTVPGLIATHGGPSTLVFEANGATTRLTTPAPLETLNAAAARHRIDSFRVENPTLEQVFLHLTGRALGD